MKLKKHKDFILETNIETGEFSSVEEYLTKKGFILENDRWNKSSAVMLENKHRSLLIKDGQLVIKFGIIKGGFTVTGSGVKDDSLKLTSVEGLPTKCLNLNISHNNLTSLKGIGDFDELDASYNKLTSLEGCPIKIDGDFDVHKNEITSCKGGPEEVHGYFDISSNKLTDLQGCPIVYEGATYMQDNDIKTAYGLKRIDRSFSISKRDFQHVCEEELEFLRSKVSNKGYVFEDYPAELTTYVINNYDEKNILNLTLPEEYLNRMPEEYRNIYSSSKGLKKFNM